MRTNIHAQLNRAFDVDTENVLQVDVCNQVIGSERSFDFNAPDATRQRIELAGDEVTIHGWV